MSLFTDLVMEIGVVEEKLEAAQSQIKTLQEQRAREVEDAYREGACRRGTYEVGRPWGLDGTPQKPRRGWYPKAWK